MIPSSPDYKAQLTSWFSSMASKAKDRCEVCHGNGYVLGLLASPSRRCECMVKVNREFCLRRGNVPREYRDQEFEITNAGVKEFIKKLDSDGDCCSLLLTGSYGTGKTTIACQMLVNAASLDKSIFRIEATEVERALSLIKSRQSWVDQWLQDGMYSDVVALDEMGAEAVSGTNGREARSLLSYFIKHRVENGMPTIMCTNLVHEDFTNHYGEAIASVVFGHRYLEAMLEGQDFRR